MYVHMYVSMCEASALCPAQADLGTDFQGFVRVHMCVTRPIHVSAGVTKNSWYGLMKPVRAKTKRYKGKGKQKKADSGIECGDNEVSPSPSCTYVFVPLSVFSDVMLTLYCGRATIVAQPVVVEDDESLAHFVQILFKAYT